jgi:LDH2 family malate/lactate/ureidoglycolate dehydrogenase
MKHVKTYMAKIDGIIESNSSKKTTDNKGLLAPSNQSKSNTQASSTVGIELVAAYVKAIRQARKGMKNGNR